MKTQEALMADARNFMKSRVILTGAELDIFTFLDKESAAAETLARRLRLDVRATTRLLDCLVTFGLLGKREGHYSNAPQAATLSSRHPETVLPMVLHLNHLWDTWTGLTEIVKKGTAQESEQGIKFSEKDWAAFIGAMHVVARGLSMEIVHSYDASGFKKLLDVGGASGTYTIAFLKKNPLMHAVIFDLQDVIPMATERIAAEGLSDRVETVAGDFYEDELPPGCDMALLSAIIHQNSPRENGELYRKIYSALEPGGILLIRDHIMDDARTTPQAGALFAINMLVNTHGGDTYTFREVRESLEKAGFTQVKLLQTGEQMDCLVEAKKPA
jgi:SAM-dependent methyltransferase